ncbi:MAG: acylneuraminate cytidylyltransferase family protein [Paraglaciecola sp.]|nr:acylneuraminate cytidylyltransferase family protein [Paraglaciecola sp.]
MRVVCVIPARGGSKGLPGKNIKLINGKPLLAWSILQAINSSTINAGVYVSSDCQEILAVAKEYGAQEILRPDSLATDTASSEDALRHAVETIIKNDEKIDYVVFLQCTSPIRRPDDIDKAVNKISQTQSDSLLSVQELRDYFVWECNDDIAHSLNFDYKNRQRRQDLPVRYLENGSIYVFKPQQLFESGNRLGGKICLYAMDKIASQQVDDPSDFEFCESIMRGMP